jgi:hypothetical protein
LIVVAQKEVGCLRSAADVLRLQIHSASVQFCLVRASEYLLFFLVSCLATVVQNFDFRLVLDRIPQEGYPVVIDDVTEERTRPVFSARFARK